MSILTKRTSLAIDHSEHKILFLTIIFLSAVASVFALDMYVPALPEITHYFGSTATAVKWTVTVYTLSFALSQLFYGPFSDKYGRRTALLLGLGVSVIGSLLCATAHDISMLLLGRFIQGAGIGAAACLARSSIRDVASGQGVAKIGSYFSLCVGLAPALAPFLGSYLQHYISWQSIFIFYTVYTLILFTVILIFLPETNTKPNPNALKIKHMLENYRLIISNRDFLRHALIAGTGFSSIIVYFSLSPFLLQNLLHVSVVEYGWLSIIVAAGMMAGRVLNVAALRFLSATQLIGLGMLINFIAATAMTAAALIHYDTVAAVIVPYLFFTMGTSLIFSNAMAGAMNALTQAHIRGATGALYSFLQIFISFVMSLIAAHITQHSAINLALFLLIIAVTSNLSFYALRPKQLSTQIKITKT